MHYLLSYRARARDSISGLHKIWAVKPGKIYKNGALQRKSAAPLARPKGRKLCNRPAARQGAAAPSQARLSALICKRPARGRFGPGQGISVLHGARAGGAGNRKPKGGPWRTCPAATENVARKASFLKKQRRPAQGPAAVENKTFLHPRQNKGGRLLGCGLNLSGADARQSRRTPVQNRWL